MRADGIESSPKLASRRRVLAHMLVCKGCCCGVTEKRKPPVPVEWLKQEWRNRQLSPSITLTISEGLSWSVRSRKCCLYHIAARRCVVRTDRTPSALCATRGFGRKPWHEQTRYFRCLQPLIVTVLIGFDLPRSGFRKNKRPVNYKASPWQAFAGQVPVVQIVARSQVLKQHHMREKEAIQQC